MYYVVTQSRSNTTAVDILARCRTISGAVRRLKQEVREYHTNYGYNTIFPARPWLQESDAEPKEYSEMAAWRGRIAFESHRDARNWSGTPYAR